MLSFVYLEQIYFCKSFFIIWDYSCKFQGKTCTDLSNKRETIVNTTICLFKNVFHNEAQTRFITAKKKYKKRNINVTVTGNSQGVMVS